MAIANMTIVALSQEDFPHRMTTRPFNDDNIAEFVNQKDIIIQWCNERFGKESLSKSWKVRILTERDLYHNTTLYAFVWSFVNQEDAVEFSLLWL